MPLPSFLQSPTRTQPATLAIARPSEAAAVTHPEPEQRAKYERLHELENVIAGDRLKWVRTGRALREINQDGLYRVRSASFEQYLAERWGMKKRQAYDLITAAGVGENLQTERVKHTLSVRAAVKLAKLTTAAEQAACLREAIAGSGTLSPPADYVAAAVASRLPAKSKVQSPKSKVKKSKPKPVRLCLASGYTLTVLCNRAGADLATLLREALAQLTAPEAETAHQP